MERRIKKTIFDDLVETMTLYEETKSRTNRRNQTSKRNLHPPGHRLEMIAKLDIYRRRYKEISECAHSALCFARKSVDIMRSYEDSIICLEDEMRTSSGLNHRKNKKSRSLARYAVKSVQTDVQDQVQNVQERPTTPIQISSEEDLDFEEPQRFVVDVSHQIV